MDIRNRGQSMIEVALVLPLLLLIVAAAVEIGVYFNAYIDQLDATRESARFLSDDDPSNRDNVHDCGTTTDFYRQGFCLALQNFARTRFDGFDPATDDIVVSNIAIRNCRIADRIQASYCADSGACTPDASLFNDDDLNSKIRASAQLTNTAEGDFMVTPGLGWVVVEIYHVHHQFLGLIPPGLSFLPQDVMIHAYTIMPLNALTETGNDWRSTVCYHSSP